MENIEFQITFCETNLRYLLGEPESEDRDNKIAFMKSEIKRLKEEVKI